MKSKITLKLIAKELGVSISTVSKALKNSLEISEGKRKLIQDYAKTKNYKPNVLALQLQSQHSKIIAIIIPEIVHFFFAKVIMGVEEYAAQKGYYVIICSSNESLEREIMNFRFLSNRNVEGVLISPAKETLVSNYYEHIQEYIDSGNPLVLFDRSSKDLSCDEVVIDDFKSGYDAVNHLIEKKRTKIGIISTLDAISISRKRKEGGRKAMADNGLSIDDEYILQIDELENSDMLIKEYLIKNKLDAVFCVNEIYAGKLIKIARDLNLKIPKDIAVVGFSDGLISEFLDPPLTTVFQNPELIGREAVKLLIERIENKSENKNKKTIVVPTYLKVRSST